MLPTALLVLLSPSPATACVQDASADRFLSDRASPVRLELPEDDDAFTFAIFGDRTGGPAEGVAVLAQAVAETNLVDPDLVMTVGDLVEGYNERPEWLTQMREFRGIMDRLTCPWFPVAGNHDVYWRGGTVPPEEHEGDYEAHFGPLWYAFRHKDAWFLALYSDEPDPATGKRDFNSPASQRMSPAQLAFLDQALAAASGARHVFVFLHHPRWHGGNYGDDWEQVHERLVAAGNVRAVFAGHIHRMLYDGVRDGIEYFTLATVGGGQSEVVPNAGYLHHWNLVTVRDGGISMIAVPVGAALDPRALTHALSDEARATALGLAPEVTEVPQVHADGSAAATYRLRWTNAGRLPLELDVLLESTDAAWTFLPEHQTRHVAPLESVDLEFQALRPAEGLGSSFDLPSARVSAAVLENGLAVRLPDRSHPLPLVPVGLTAQQMARPEEERAFAFDGQDDCLAVADRDLALPDGPLTVECWLRAARWGERVGVVTKTESSEFGLFCYSGSPEFSVHLAGRYASARAADVTIPPGRWTHVAGVFDGAEARLYVDGARVARAPASGARTRNALPLLVGADVDGAGRGTSFFEGELDEVRVSKVARYAGAQVRPARRVEPDADTALLLHLDRRLGPWAIDHSAQAAHGLRRGAPRPVEAGDSGHGEPVRGSR